MMKYIRFFNQVGLKDLVLVGGKNASLGEMRRELTSKGIRVPDGFATTAQAYWFFIQSNQLQSQVKKEINRLNTKTFKNLHRVGQKIRQKILKAQLPEELKKELLQAYHHLKKNKLSMSVAVRSSATAEDLPSASFAGQLETYLNIRSDHELLQACLNCFASLFTDRAIQYRAHQGFDQLKVALSIGVQEMVRSDQACSGVMFSLDPDSGFRNVVLISGAWGLGENVVQGAVNTDEFLVSKAVLSKSKQPIISRRLGSKQKIMIYGKGKSKTLNLKTPANKQKQFILNDLEIIQLARWAVEIEKHYGRPMDMEWAKDGQTKKLYVVQARPETVYSSQKIKPFKLDYRLKNKGKKLCQGIGLGHRIASGPARILHSPKQIGKLKKGEILITRRTDPDWDPILKKAAAIVTDLGGRTSHAAIVAREVGAIAIVGSGNATQKIKNGQMITVDTSQGDEGFVFAGKLSWTEKKTRIPDVSQLKTQPMLILAHPDQAFEYAQLPGQGVGLMRMEFIINNAIGIHPMALCHFQKVKDAFSRKKILEKTTRYSQKTQFFVNQLAEATAKIAAAFYPRPVIVRMSDFKTNEYANLIGGKYFEPSEENPMIGFRGASRYYNPLYQDGFALECAAMKRVREVMGFENVKLMIPFCRTLTEAKDVLKMMQKFGLKRGQKNLEIYVMIEIPSNAVLADEFAKLFDGFSIGSNDLTQLTLGADRDSTLLADIFSPFDPAVMELIRHTIQTARKKKIPVGLCGQAPSDFPKYAQFLVKCGIHSISFNPDALWQGIENIAKAEKR